MRNITLINHHSHPSSAPRRPGHAVSTIQGTTSSHRAAGRILTQFSRPIYMIQSICCIPIQIDWFNPIWLPIVGLLEGRVVQNKARQNFRSTGKKLSGLGEPSQQQIWWLLVSRLLIAVKYAIKLSVVILHTCTTFANTVNASADSFNVFIPFTESVYVTSFFETHSINSNFLRWWS